MFIIIVFTIWWCNEYTRAYISSGISSQHIVTIFHGYLPVENVAPKNSKDTNGTKSSSSNNNNCFFTTNRRWLSHDCSLTNSNNETKIPSSRSLYNNSSLPIIWIHGHRYYSNNSHPFLLQNNNNKSKSNNNNQ